MELIKILEGLEYESRANLEDVNIEDIIYNSKKARKNTVFLALVGKTVDGHRFIEDAYNKGTRVFVVSKDIDFFREDMLIIRVEDTRLALSKMSHNFFNKPSEEMFVIGVTGTKGKTTTSNYIKDVLVNNGLETGVIGTNGVSYKDYFEELNNTTPESYEINRLLRQMLDKGVKYVTMEVSSGGIMMNRVADIDFDIGIFTNLSKDHIGPMEHPNFQDYLDCKTRLFKMCRLGIINMDDKYADYIIENSSCKIKTYSIKKESDLRADGVELSQGLDHLGVKFDVDGENYLINSPGIFSVYNALAVISLAKELRLDYSLVYKSLRQVKVSGRVEPLPILEDATVILDYAHNKSSLTNVLDTLREYEPKRLVCLVGAVGGRSEGRRKEIGEVVSSRCDLVYLTSDNPNFEDPMEIIEDIYSHINNSDLECIKEPDRKKAVELAIRNHKKGDMILLAGKGHEDFQLIAGEKVPYSDREVAIKTAKNIK